MSEKDFYNQGFIDGREQAMLEFKPLIKAAIEWANGYGSVRYNIVKSEEASDKLYDTIMKLKL